MKRLLALGGGVVLGTVLATVLVGVFVVRSDWFRDVVRRRIISVSEDATGGRVELGNFQYDWRTMTASAGPFVLHGTEAASQPPLFRALKIELGLHVISMLARDVDVSFLRVTEPQVTITVAPDGSTNIPAPKVKRYSKDIVQDLLDLKIRKLEMTHGFAEYNAHRITIDVKAEDLNASLNYDSKGPRYLGAVKAREIQVQAPELPVTTFAFESHVAIDRSTVQIADAMVNNAQAKLWASGSIEDFSEPKGTLNVKAQYGEVLFIGRTNFSLGPRFDWQIQGQASGRAPRYSAAFNTALKLRPDRLDLSDLKASFPSGTFQGSAQLTDWRKLKLSGEIKHRLQPLPAQFPVVIPATIDALATGPIRLEAEIDVRRRLIQNAVAEAQLTLQPTGGGPPVEGYVDAAYRQAGNLLSLGDSELRIGTSRIQVSGAVGQSLTIHASTSNLTELPVALPKDLSIALKGGSAQFDGTFSGPLDDPNLSGQLDVTRFAVNGNDIDHLAGHFDLSRRGINARNITLTQQSLQLQGSAQIGLTDWKLRDASPTSGSISLKGAPIQRLREERGWKAPITGILAATADFHGTYAKPEGSVGIAAENVVAYGEPFDRVRASITLSGNKLQVIDARLTSKAGEIQGKGSFEHDPSDWISGRMQFDLSGNGLNLGQAQFVQTRLKGASGILQVTAHGAAILTKGDLQVQSVTTQSTVRDISYDGEHYGDATLTANTKGDLMDVRAEANFFNTPIQASGQWKLAGDDPGHGQIAIPRVTFATLHRAFPNPARKELPFDGFVDANIEVDGPLRKPDLMRAIATVNTVQLNASPGARPRAGAQARDLVLRNVRPIVVEATTKSLNIREARMTGTDTTVEARGRFSFDSKSPWDLRINGTVNLAVLQIFNPDLLGSGSSVVDATIRGSLTEPNVEGRLELRNASLYMADLPNGLDQANGVILFDRSRATVDSLSAVTGGGRVTLEKGSFVGFRGPSLLYRIQASADHVRYRSPEGVSLTANALLNLIGTSENSVLSGTLTVIRAGFNPTTDVGNLLATTAKPVAAPATPNEYLRGVQFDIRVETAQSLEIQTSVTRNIGAEANLRVRGTPERPVVLGNVNITEGQIDFFGNRYTINRGEVDFTNQVKIEPIIDMDLETVVRGITVDISFTGPLNKLAFSYRSDPPLQTNDILALLAVGRTPGTTATGVTTTPANTNSNYLSTGSNTLLADALKAPASGRLQKFFGVSHIKIDPQLTDITALPQARLTLEQQISKDITLTYITNLTRTQEQIVRVEWDVSRQWSVIAIRDENGAFGIDFQYRRRFK